VKIAYIVSLFPKISETFILREMQALRQRGVEIVILSLKRRREPIRHPEAESFLPGTLYAPSPVAALGPFLLRVARHPGAALAIAARVIAAHLAHPILLLKSLPLVLVAADAAERLRKAGVQHIHAHWATYPALVAWAIHRLEGIPYSITAHAHDIFLANPLLAEKIRGSAFTVTISEYNRRYLEERCGSAAAARIHVVRCGVPLGEFRFRKVEARPAGASGPTTDPPVLMSVGRLVDYKGFPTLVRAVSILRSRGRELTCEIVGEGPMLHAIQEEIRRLDLDGSVRLLGARTQGEVRERLGRAAVCVLACERGHDGQMDGIPVVLMEALALGVPAVATRISGIPEIIDEGRTGLLAPPRDPEALASAIERLLEDPGLGRRVAEEGRRKVEGAFDVEKNAGRLLELITGAGEAGR
jgi:glycosyltransferase involved in cell wall biosynthesis